MKDKEIITKHFLIAQEKFIEKWKRKGVRVRVFDFIVERYR